MSGWCLSRIPLGEDQPYLEILPLVLANYGTAVQCGTRHIFESLPRLLTLWFEFGSQQMANRSTSVKVQMLLNLTPICIFLHEQGALTFAQVKMKHKSKANSVNVAMWGLSCQQA